VRTAVAVDAGFRQAPPLDRLAFYQVFANDLLYIANLDVTVPDRFWVDHHDRTMLTLIEATGLVGPNPMLQASFLNCIFEVRF